MQNLLTFINRDLIILIPTLMVIGFLIKQANFINPNLIPLLLGFFGISLSAIFYFYQTPIFIFSQIFYGLFFSFTQGAISAGMAVYFHQLVKQAKNYYNKEK